MTEEEYNGDFWQAIQATVLDSILKDLSSSIKYEDWLGRGFDQAEHLLNAKNVSSMISVTAERYFEDDETNKSGEILEVILKYADDCDVIELQY